MLITKISIFLFTDVLTVGPGPTGCRQTMTTVEENVSCCTSIKVVNLVNQHLPCMEPLPVVLTATTANSSSSSSSSNRLVQVPRVSAMIHSSPDKYRKVSWVNTTVMAGTPPTVVTNTSCPLLPSALISSSSSNSSINRVSAATASTPMQAPSSLQLSQTAVALLSQRRLSLLHRHQRHLETVSYLRHLFRPMRPISTPRHSLWVVILLLIAFSPPLLRAPVNSVDRCHQLLQLQRQQQRPRSRDSLRPIDCWLRTQRWPTLRNSNDILPRAVHRPKDCSPHRFAECFKDLVDTVSPQLTDCSRHRRFTLRCPRGLPVETVPVAFAKQTKGVVATSKTRHFTKGTTVATRARHRSDSVARRKRGSFRARRIRKGHIRDTRPTRGYSRRRRVNDDTLRIGASKRHAKNTGKQGAQLRRRLRSSTGIRDTKIVDQGVHRTEDTLAREIVSTSWPCKDLPKAGRLIDLMGIVNRDTCQVEEHHTMSGNPVAR